MNKKHIYSKLITYLKPTSFEYKGNGSRITLYEIWIQNNYTFFFFFTANESKAKVRPGLVVCCIIIGKTCLCLKSTAYCGFHNLTNIPKLLLRLFKSKTQVQKYKILMFLLMYKISINHKINPPLFVSSYLQNLACTGALNTYLFDVDMTNYQKHTYINFTPTIHLPTNLCWI